MKLYAANGKTAATAATIDVAIAALWNPSTVRSLYVKEIQVFKQTAGAADEPLIRRITARGTPTSTVTPTIRNDYDNDIAPPSGALLDLAYSAQPTMTAAEALFGTVQPASIGTGMIWVFGGDGIRVPAGAGLAIVTGIALAFPVSRITFAWGE